MFKKMKLKKIQKIAKFLKNILLKKIFISRRFKVKNNRLRIKTVKN